MTTNTNSITAENITNKQIRKLRDEAGAASDMTMVAICDIARDVYDSADIDMTDAERAEVAKYTRETARAKCAEVLDYSRGEREAAAADRAEG